jgi:hypothetical protein
MIVTRTRNRRRAAYLEQLRSHFLEQIVSLPHDLFVPKCTNHARTSPAPATQEHFTLAHNADTLAVVPPPLFLTPWNGGA